MPQLEYVCKPPALVGQPCEGLVCEGYVCRGAVVGTAHVTYLKFAGTWHRFSLDPGAVHWRLLSTPPAPWSMREAGLDYPHTDVAALAGVLGVRLASYCVSSDSGGITAVFEFENRRMVFIRYRDERASFGIG